MSPRRRDADRRDAPRQRRGARAGSPWTPPGTRECAAPARWRRAGRCQRAGRAPSGRAVTAPPKGRHRFTCTPQTPEAGAASAGRILDPIHREAPGDVHQATSAWLVDTRRSSRHRGRVTQAGHLKDARLGVCAVGIQHPRNALYPIYGPGGSRSRDRTGAAWAGILRLVASPGVGSREMICSRTRVTSCPRSANRE